MHEQFPQRRYTCDAQNFVPQQWIVLEIPWVEQVIYELPQVFSLTLPTNSLYDRAVVLETRYKLLAHHGHADDRLFTISPPPQRFVWQIRTNGSFSILSKIS